MTERWKRDLSERREPSINFREMFLERIGEVRRRACGEEVPLTLQFLIKMGYAFNFKAVVCQSESTDKTFIFLMARASKEEIETPINDSKRVDYWQKWTNANQ